MGICKEFRERTSYLKNKQYSCPTLIVLHNRLREYPAGNATGGFNVVPLRRPAYDKNAFTCRKPVNNTAGILRYTPHCDFAVLPNAHALRPQYEPEQYGGEASAAQCDDDKKQHKPLFIAETVHCCTDQQ